MKTILIILAILSVTFCLFFAAVVFHIGAAIVIVGFLIFLGFAFRESDKQIAREKAANEARYAQLVNRRRK